MNQHGMPEVLDPARLSNSFLGDTIQICVVTRDHRKRMAGFVNLGIGPWAVYDFAPPHITETTYRGRPGQYAMRLCLAWSGNMLWEIIEPTAGESIYTEFLEAQGEGIQHVAVACGDLGMQARIDEFRARGYEMVQSGVFNGDVPYAYFDTRDDLGTIVEIFDIPETGLPDPVEWYPAPPPGS